MPGYPAILRVEGRLCVVLGGGRIAQGKVERLLEGEAKVRVVAPEVTDAIRRLADQGRVELIDREYEDGDLAGAFLGIGATDDPDVNARAFAEAEAANVLFNAVDDAEHGTFIAPAIVRNGALVLAISTDGASPALAVRIKERLRELFGGAEYARFLELAASLRDEVRDTGQDFDTRAELWYRLVDSDVLDLLRDGRDEDARARARECLSLP
jgi:precorrin-2 dehydrogenase/sirohydrochlorin ferrochelatase